MQQLVEILNCDVVDWVRFEQILQNITVRKNASFNRRIIPTARKIVGWYIPDLRSIAQRIESDNILRIIDTMPQNFYEETILLALLLGRIKSYSNLEPRLDKFLLTIDNWATCDILCGELKIVKRFSDLFWDKILVWAVSSTEFVARFAFVLMKNFYINDAKIDEVLHIAGSKATEHYYVNMALGWLYAEASIRYSDRVFEVLTRGDNHPTVIQYTQNKVRDSFRVSDETKVAFRNMPPRAL